MIEETNTIPTMILPSRDYNTKYNEGTGHPLILRFQGVKESFLHVTPGRQLYFLLVLWVVQGRYSWASDILIVEPAKPEHWYLVQLP